MAILAFISATIGWRAPMVGRNGTPYLRRLESMCSMSAPDRRGASNRLGAGVVHWQRGRWLVAVPCAHNNNTHPFVAGRFVAALSQRSSGSFLEAAL